MVRGQCHARLVTGSAERTRETVMAKIISFPAGARKVLKGAQTHGKGAQVIIFPGVRYEYLVDEPASGLPDSRRALRPA